MSGSPLNLLLSDFPKSHLWPRAIRNAFYKKHMNNAERFKVTVFFLVNQVPPEILLNAYEFKFKDFDQQAWRQIHWIIKKYPTSKWKAWNLSERRTTD
jgi:hypothetical protein